MYVPELRLSQQLKSYLQESIHSDHLEKSVKHELSKFLQESSCSKDQGDNITAVPVKLVKSSLEALNYERTEPLYIHEMITDSELHLQKYEPPQRSAELESRIQRLKREAENREYRQMTQNVNRTKQIVDGNVGKELKAMNLQMIAVVNFVITVGGAFAFGYKATEASMEHPDIAIQMLVGILLGTAVFFADLYFLVKKTM